MVKKGEKVSFPKQICTDTDSKLCIYSNCPAFVYHKPSLLKCEVCGQQFQRGSSCDEDDHKRLPIQIKEFYYCKRYKYRWDSDYKKDNK